MQKHRLSMMFVLAAALLVAVVPLRASDPVGAYCLISKVVLEPNDTEPLQIQIWGAFAMTSGERGDGYQPAVAGYLYYACPKGQDAVCQKEWADLKSVAGKLQGVGIGGRFKDMGRVRSANQTPASPDPYPIQMGVMWMGNFYTHDSILADLKKALDKK